MNMAANEKNLFRQNICQTCKFGIKQESGYLVNCVCDRNGRGGCGNAFELEGQCKHYRPNHNLLFLKHAAITAIRNYHVLADTPEKSSHYKQDLAVAASESVALKRAYAMIVGLNYDAAAEILYEDAFAE